MYLDEIIGNCPQPQLLSVISENCIHCHGPAVSCQWVSIETDHDRDLLVVFIFHSGGFLSPDDSPVMWCDESHKPRECDSVDCLLLSGAP